MPMIPVAERPVGCIAPSTIISGRGTRRLPVVMMHGFARNARFWNRWVPSVAESRRVYRPDLLGCGESDVPPADYRYTPEAIAAQVMAVLDALAWNGCIGSASRRAASSACCSPPRIPTASPAWCCATRRPASPTRSSASTRSTGRAPRRRCAPMASANGAGRRSATGSTSSTPIPNCRTGSSPRWTAPRPDIAAAMHDCFEAVDTLPLLAGI